MLNFFNTMFAEGGAWSWVFDIVDAIDFILWPILIIVGAAGSIYAIILGINIAKADSTDKREEAKKHLINVLIGLAVVIALILFFKLLVADGGILDQILGDRPAEVKPPENT